MKRPPVEAVPEAVKNRPTPQSAPCLAILAQDSLVQASLFVCRSLGIIICHANSRRWQQSGVRRGWALHED